MAISDIIKKLNVKREQNLRLTVPHGTLFGFLFVMMLVLFVLVSLSSHYMIIVTVPILALWAYALYWFAGVWRSFGYSAAVLLLFVAVTVAIGIFVGRPAVQALWIEIRMVFE